MLILYLLDNCFWVICDSFEAFRFDWPFTELTRLSQLLIPKLFKKKETPFPPVQILSNSITEYF